MAGCAAPHARVAQATPLAAPPVEMWPRLADWRARFEAASFASKSGTVLSYAIAKPPGNVRRPLVVVLPGKWEMGTDNQRQLTPFAASWVQLYDDDGDGYADAPIVVAPQVSERSVVYGDCLRRNCRARPGPSFGPLLEFIDYWRAKDEVDSDRVYLVGFSMGGGTALQLTLARPNTFANVAVFGTVPPPRKRAPELKSENLLLVQGSKDRRHPLSVLKGWVKSLLSSGGKAKLDVREGMKHQIPDDMIVDRQWRVQFLQKRRDRLSAGQGTL